MTVKPCNRIILLGPPGAGKGTQAQGLSSALGLKHISAGAVFRFHKAKGTNLGIHAEKYMGQGRLVPDDVTIKMVLEDVLSPSSRNGFILDGFPRTLVQAQRLDEALEEAGHHIEASLLIRISKEELMRRLTGRCLCRKCQTSYHMETSPPKVKDICDQCGSSLYLRDDDRPEAVETRLEVYHTQTEPLAEYYQQQNRLRFVEGVGSIEDIQQRLLNALYPQNVGRTLAN